MDRRSKSTTEANPTHRDEQIRRFEDTKLGVKGLVDSGLTTIPPLFVHPAGSLSDLKLNRPKGQAIAIPIIDLSAGTREEAVDQVAREMGFFQVVNHGVAPEVLDRLIGAVREQDAESKQAKYTRTGRVSLFSNVDLFHSKAANWRDTLQIRLSPSMENDEEFPEICREEIREYDEGIKGFARELLGLLCEGLGVNTRKLEDMTCLEARIMMAHYYPRCPQPDLTFGITSPSDPGVITVLLQNAVGGLQIKHGNEWLVVKPVPGALVINIGDILQIMSNDEYQSRAWIIGCWRTRIPSPFRAISRASNLGESRGLQAVHIQRLPRAVLLVATGWQIFGELLQGLRFKYSAWEKFPTGLSNCSFCVRS